MSALSRLALAAALAWSAPVQAMDYGFKFEKHRLVITAKGYIETDEDVRFRHFVATLPTKIDKPESHTVIVLDSLGGFLDAGLSLGRLIAYYGVATSVAADGSCASACTVVWASGARKSVESGASIGVHNAGGLGEAGHSPKPATDAKATQEATNIMARWLASHGAPDSVVTKTLKTPPSDVYWLTDAEVSAWTKPPAPANCKQLWQAFKDARDRLDWALWADDYGSMRLSLPAALATERAGQEFHAACPQGATR